MTLQAEIQKRQQSVSDWKRQVEQITALAGDDKNAGVRVADALRKRKLRASLKDVKIRDPADVQRRLANSADIYSFLSCYFPDVFCPRNLRPDPGPGRDRPAGSHADGQRQADVPEVGAGLHRPADRACAGPLGSAATARPVVAGQRGRHHHPRARLRDPRRAGRHQAPRPGDHRRSGKCATGPAAASRRTSAERTIEADLAGLGGPGKRLARVMLTTTMSSYSLSATYIDRARKPSWKGRRMQFIIAWPLTTYHIRCAHRQLCRGMRERGRDQSY